jgi:hypothetical protein
MTEYMLAVHSVEGAPAPDQETMQKMYAQVGAFNEEVTAAGIWVFAGGLQPRDTATVVDGTGDEPLITDGPFAESKEYLGGFWVINVPDLDTALDWARRGSAACQGPVEVRPFQEM